MIKELTPEQWAAADRCREETLARALGFHMDRDAFERGIAHCYEKLGMARPRVEWADGPREVIDRVQAEHRRRGLAVPSRSDVHENSASWGWRLAWVTHWLFVNELEGITPVAKDVSALGRSWADVLFDHYWVPYEDYVCATENHNLLERDNQQRLHCTTGPAWGFRDGTSIYALDGIRVPDWVIEAPDPQRIIAELANTEQRRVAFAQYGWEKVVTDLNMTALDVHEDPLIGSLYDLPKEAINPDEERAGARLLVCRNASPNRDGTTNIYGLLVAPECRTALEAQAWANDFESVAAYLEMMEHTT